MRYVGVDVAYLKTLLLRSDGLIAYAGDPSGGQAIVPPLPVGLRYVDVAAVRAGINVALRSDASLVWWGGGIPSSPPWPWFWVPLPTLPFGVYAVDIDGSDGAVVIRCSDGMIRVAGAAGEHEHVVPPLDPGTSYVEASGSSGFTVAGRVGPTSTYVSFTQGCAGSMQPARLIPRDTPAIGKTLPVNVCDLPHSLAILLFGTQRLTPALPLAALGMPGCDLHVTIDATFPLVGAQNQAQWLFPIPDDQSLVGMHFFNQAVVFDAAAPNMLGAVMSNAAEGVIGHW